MILTTSTLYIIHYLSHPFEFITFLIISKHQKASAKNLWLFIIIKQMTDSEAQVRDSNGNILSDGDSVTIIKDLKVKGSNNSIKRGTLMKNISLNPNSSEPIECSGQYRGFSIKAEYVKKA